MTSTKRSFEFEPRGWPQGFMCCVTYHPAQKQTGEWNYSLGDPPVSASCEFEYMCLNGRDVTEWCNEMLLLDEEALEEEGLDCVPEYIERND